LKENDIQELVKLLPDILTDQDRAQIIELLTQKGRKPIDLSHLEDQLRQWVDQASSSQVWYECLWLPLLRFALACVALVKQVLSSFKDDVRQDLYTKIGLTKHDLQLFSQVEKSLKDLLSSGQSFSKSDRLDLECLQKACQRISDLLRSPGVQEICSKVRRAPSGQKLAAIFDALGYQMTAVALGFGDHSYLENRVNFLFKLLDIQVGGQSLLVSTADHLGRLIGHYHTWLDVIAKQPEALLYKGDHLTQVHRPNMVKQRLSAYMKRKLGEKTFKKIHQKLGVDVVSLLQCMQINQIDWHQGLHILENNLYSLQQQGIRNLQDLLQSKSGDRAFAQFLGFKNLSRIMRVLPEQKYQLLLKDIGVLLQQIDPNQLNHVIQKLIPVIRRFQSLTSRMGKQLSRANLMDFLAISQDTLNLTGQLLSSPTFDGIQSALKNVDGSKKIQKLMIHFGIKQHLLFSNLLSQSKHQSTMARWLSLMDHPSGHQPLIVQINQELRDLLSLYQSVYQPLSVTNKGHFVGFFKPNPSKDPSSPSSQTVINAKG
jgi:hypothetical protein